MNILYAIVSGGLAGIISWIIVSLSFIEQASPVLKPLLRGIVLGIFFGGFLGMVKMLGDKSFGKAFPEVLDSLVMGVTGGVASQALIIGFDSSPDKSLISSMAGWVVFGLFLGAGQRLAKPAVKGVLYGIIGGVVGGGFGGIAMDFISKSPAGAAWWGPAVGMIVLGLFLGATINVILLSLAKEEKKLAPAAPQMAPVMAPKQEIKAEPAKPVPAPVAAPKPEVKVEPPKAAPVPTPVPAQPLKKYLEANFLVEKTQITIGSSTDNDIIIRAPGVEQRQAMIYQEQGRFLVKNIGTSKEIFVSFTGDLNQGRNLAVNGFNALKEGSAMKVDKEFLMFFHSTPPSLSVRYPVDKDRLIIGTSPQNDIVIKDSSASARHAQVNWEKERGLVTDLGSSSGTYVSYSGDKAQERKVQEKNAITNNSSIRIGNTTFKVLTF